MSKVQIVKIVSQDNEEFEVERGVAFMSTLIANVLSDVSEEESTVPIPNVQAKILAKVIEYCRYHYESRTADQTEEEVDKWDREFIRVDNPTLFSIILAANFMDIKGLLDLGCKTVANMIKDKSAEQIRELFGIKNDFTKEEEEGVKKENAWCEDI